MIQEATPLKGRNCLGIQIPKHHKPLNAKCNDIMMNKCNDIMINKAKTRSSGSALPAPPTSSCPRHQVNPILFVVWVTTSSSHWLGARYSDWSLALCFQYRTWHVHRCINVASTSFILRAKSCSVHSKRCSVHSKSCSPKVPLCT